MMSKGTIIIACDSFLALRNVRNAELGSRLGEVGYQVKVYVDPHQMEGSIAARVPDIVICPLQDFNPGANKALVKWLNWMELSRKSYKDPQTFLSKLEYRLANRRWAKHASIPYLVLGWSLGLVGFYKLFRQLALVEIRKTVEYNSYRNLLKKEMPALVAGFSPDGNREMALLQAASDLGIPTIIMIRSRDNLVSKISFLSKVDNYLVWSEHQKIYFYHLYPEFRNSVVRAIGSPQFSRHNNPAFRLPRHEFFKRIGLDESRPLVVFCLENPAIVSHQANMAIALAEVFCTGRIHKNAQLLIRNHPRAFGSDYDPLKGRKFKDVAVYPPPTSKPLGQHDNDLVRFVLEDEPMQLATMAYQNLNVNIMSTATIDSVIFDKPVIHMAFDIPVDTPANVSVKRFFKRSDYKIIEKTGATDKASSMDDLVRLINYNLEKPEEKSKQRNLLVAKDIGILKFSESDELLNTFILACSQKKL